MAFTNSNDINILQASDSNVVGAGAGDDRYVLSASTLAANQQIQITDTQGINALQLVGGLVIVSSRVTSEALQLTLNNGAMITILGANTFNYITGGDSLTGAGGTTQSFSTFVPQSLGTTIPAPGAAPTSGGAVTVNASGGTTSGGGTTPPPPPPPTQSANYNLTSDLDNVSTTQTANNSLGVAELNTLNNGDRILDNSTIDNDTLNVDLLGDLNNSVNISNIENLNFNVLAGVSTLDTTNYVGVKTLASKGAGSLNVTNLQSTATTLKMESAGNLSVTHAAFAVGGSNDSVTVELARTTGASLSLGAGVELLRLRTNSGEVNSLSTLAGASITTLQLTGAGEIVVGNGTTLNSLASTITTIDGRTAGKTTLFLQGAATTAVLTGTSDDAVRFDTGLGLSNLISTGAGIDTLTLGSAQNFAASINGVENINLTAENANVALTNTVGGVALDFRNGGTLTVTDATAGSTIKTSTAGTTGNVNVAYAAAVNNQALLLDLTRAVNSGSTLNVTNVADLTVSVSSAGGQTFGAVTLDDSAGNTDTTKKLTLEARGAVVALTTGNILSASTLTDLTLKATGSGSSVTTGAVTADALKNLVIAASNGGASLGVVNAGSALNTIDIEVGTGNLTAGALTDITGSNAAGIGIVSLKASTGNIGAAGANAGLAISNSLGGIKTVFLSGLGDTFASLTAGLGRVENVTSSATGGVTLTLNNTLAADAAGSTVSLGNASSGKQNTLTIVGNGKDTVNGGTGTDVIDAGAGNDSIFGGAGADALTGADGSDKLTGGAGNDIFAFANQASTRNASFDFSNSTNVNLDHITDFSGNGVDAGDAFRFDLIEPTMPSGVNFAANATATVTARTVANADSFTALAAALNAPATGFPLPTTPGPVAASADNAAQVLDVTVSGGTLAGRYLVVNDGAAGVQTGDIIINITGVTGAIHASDFLFV